MARVRASAANLKGQALLGDAAGDPAPGVGQEDRAALEVGAPDQLPFADRGDQVVDPRRRLVGTLRGGADEALRGGGVEAAERDRVDAAEAPAGLAEALEAAVMAELDAGDRGARGQEGGVDALRGEAEGLEAAEVAVLEVAQRGAQLGGADQRAGLQAGRRWSRGSRRGRTEPVAGVVDL